MDLGLAGSLSGMGQNLNQGLQTLNSGIVQAGINQGLAKNDRDFQLQKLQMQQQFEKELMGQKMAADRQNTLDQIAAQGQNAKDIAAIHGQTAKDVEGMQQAGANDRLTKQLNQNYDLELKKLDVTKDIHDKDRAMLESRYKQMYSLEDRKLAVTKGAVHTISTGDGRIALMTPTGKPLGYLKDMDGNEIKAPTDLPKTAMIEVNSILDEMHDMSREYAKQPMHTPDQEDEYNARKKQMRAQIAEILQPFNGKKGASTPAPTKIIIPDKYKGAIPPASNVPTPGPTSSVTPPSATPSPMTKAPNGMMGTAQGLVPGLGMMQNYLQNR